MKISIVTVCFNSENTIEDTIKSVLNQSYENIEYIIIDGNSTDKTKDIIKKYINNIDIFISESDAGIYFAMNKGISAATGEFIGFLNSDDIFASENIIKSIAELILSNQLDVIYGNLQIVKRDNLDFVIRNFLPGKHTDGLCLKGWHPPHPTLYVRRNIMIELNGFDTRYKLQSDIDFMLKLFEIKKVKSFYCDLLFVKMRNGGTSTSSLSNIIFGNIEAFISFRRNQLGSGFFYVFMKIANKFKQFELKKIC